MTSTCSRLAPVRSWSARRSCPLDWHLSDRRACRSLSIKATMTFLHETTQSPPKCSKVWPSLNQGTEIETISKSRICLCSWDWSWSNDRKSKSSLLGIFGKSTCWKVANTQKQNWKPPNITQMCSKSRAQESNYRKTQRCADQNSQNKCERHR